ncbi:MAG: hypothetical protein AAGM84_12405 [Pseudomonadota bacterium]
MTEFLRVLALYYACDGAAAIRQLTPSEWAQCTRHYEAVKSHFDGTTSAERYTAFKTWERANGELVAEIRAGSDAL